MGISRQGWGTTGALRGLAAATLVAGSLAAGAAQADGTHFRKAMPYAEARGVLQRLGYQPYFMPGADICDPNDPRCYPEQESCVKARTYACTYTWRHGKAIIEVETRYDHPVVARSECIVNCFTLSARRGARAPQRAMASRASPSHAE